MVVCLFFVFLGSMPVLAHLQLQHLFAEGVCSSPSCFASQCAQCARRIPLGGHQLPIAPCCSSTCWKEITGSASGTTEMANAYCRCTCPMLPALLFRFRCHKRSTAVFTWPPCRSVSYSVASQPCAEFAEVFHRNGWAVPWPCGEVALPSHAALSLHRTRLAC